MSTSFAETRNFEWYCSGSLVGTSSVPPNTGEAYYTYVGLSPNTWYHLDVKVYGAAWNYLTSLSTDGQTEPNPNATKIYNGSSWIDTIPYIWNGSSWIEATSYIWNGSSWVQTIS